MKKSIVLFLFSAIGGLLPALAGGFRTVLVDAERQPVPGAVVSFYTLPDSALVDAVTSDAKGHVAFADANPAPMVLRIQALGFLPFVDTAEAVGDTLQLARPTNQLRELVVNARPVMQRTAGQFTYLPNDLRTKTDNSFELLRLVPLLDVSDRGISIFGKGSSRIFINGRDPMIGLDATMEMLRATPPSHIVRIEIITAPGSRYSAADSRGIVNVVLSNPYEGIRGSTTASASYEAGRVAPYYSLWLGASKGKFNASASLMYWAQNTHSKERTTYTYAEDNRYVTNLSRTSGYSNYLSGAITATYDFTKKSFLSLGVRINDTKSYIRNSVATETSENGNPAVHSTSDIHTRTPFGGPNYGFVGYYQLRTDDKGSSLEIAADYYASRNRSNTDYVFGATTAAQSESQKSRGAHFRSDYTWIFNDSHMLSAGYNFFRSKLDDDFDFYAESNRFVYREMVNSAYASWRASWSGAFSTSAGLRVENTRTDGHLIDTGERTKRNYTDLSPSISLSVDLPRGNQNISLDFSRSISRPWYQKLNPFIRWTSDNTYTKGNPYEKPAYSWFWSLYYSFLRDFVLNAQYYTYTDLPFDYQYSDGSGNTVSSTTNQSSEHVWDIKLQYSKTFWGKYNLRVRTGVEHIKVDAAVEGDIVRFRNFHWFLDIRNIFRLPRYGLQLYLSYSLKSPAGSFMRETGRWSNGLTFEASKSFKNGISTAVEVYNIIDRKSPTFYYGTSYSYRQQRLTAGTAVTLKISYRFGKQRVRGAEEANSPELEQRLSR